MTKFSDFVFTPDVLFGKPQDQIQEEFRYMVLELEQTLQQYQILDENK